MKKLITIFFVLFFFHTSFAQSPASMGYQAVIRDASNVLVDNQAIGMQISILQGSATGSAVYVETQTPNSNDNGLVTIQIGDGTIVSGNFSTIDWSNGPYFVKTETDPTGGITYTITGTSQLMSVPYALHATTADSISRPTAWTINGDHIYSSQAGNVGIGTTGIPNSKMYILNDAPDVATFKNSTSGQGAFSQFYNSDESVRGIIGVDGAGYSGTLNQFSISTWTNHPIDFRTNTQSRMLIDETGNVGIGTTDPSAKLDVVGNFQLENGTEGADKILKSDANGNASWEEVSNLSGLPTGTPTGSIMIWSAATPPAGWLICNGSAIDKTTYSDLFNVIGTTYGESGSNFNLPNLQERIPVGVSSATEYQLGNQGGTTENTPTISVTGTVEDHTLTIAEMPSHNHKNGAYDLILKSDGTGTIDGVNNSFGEPNLLSGSTLQDEGGGQPHSHGFSATATSTSVSTIQPYIALHYIIKY